MSSRRRFLFDSFSAAALLSPVLSIRAAEAQARPRPRLFVWVNCQGYPSPDDFYPTGTEAQFTLPRILSSLEDLKRELVIVDGVDIPHTGFDPGSNHVRMMGKVLTAKDIVRHPSNTSDGLHGDASIDQRIARELGVETLEVLVNASTNNWLRERPFATGPRQAKPPLVSPAAAWDKAFRALAVDRSEEERRRLLLEKRSLLDGVLSDLARFRRELAGVEREKLDLHEDAIRRAELAVARDLAASPPVCAVPGRPSAGGDIPTRATAHLDVMYAALLCRRVEIGGMCWGYSGYHWLYGWVGGVNAGSSIHDEVHHRADSRRDSFARAATWDWTQLAGLLRRMRDTPDGSGTMLDDTLVLAISHFGHHHHGARVPAILAGRAGGRLRTGRHLRLPRAVDNGKLLTSVAQLMGVSMTGFGNDPRCGNIPELHA